MGNAHTENFRQEYERKLERALDQFFQRIPQHQAPALHQAVQNLSARAGVEPPIICTVSDAAKKSSPQFITLDHTFAATQAGTPRLVFGRNGLLHLTGDATGRTVSKELEAVIGHELAHVKYDRGLGKALLIKHAPFIGAIAGLASYQLYQYFSQSQERRQAFADYHERGATEEEKQVMSAMPGYQQFAYRLAYNMAALALGFGVGLVAKREINYFKEFRADRFSAELLQDAKPLIEFFKRFEQPRTREMYEQTNKQFRDLGMDDKAIQQFRRKETLLDTFVHPSIKERIQRLEAMEFPSR